MKTSWDLPRLGRFDFSGNLGRVRTLGWSTYLGASWKGVYSLNLRDANFYEVLEIDSNFWDTFPHVERLIVPNRSVPILAEKPLNAYPLKNLVFGREYGYPTDPTESLQEIQTWLAGCPGITEIEFESTLEEAIRHVPSKFFEDVLLKRIHFVDKDGLVLTEDLLATFHSSNKGEQ